MTEVGAGPEEVLDRIDDGFFALDDRFRFTFLNDRAAELLAVDPERVVGEVVWDEFPSAAGTTFEEQYERAMETQEPVSFEEHYPPLGSWFEVTAYPSDTGLSVYFRDVTDRVEREKRLRTQVEQQEVVAELGQRALSAGDLDDLMADAARLVAATLDAEYCKVLDLDPEREELRLRQGVGWRDGAVGSATVSAVEADSQAAFTLSVAHPVVVEDLDAETRFSGPELLASHGVRSGVSTVVGPVDDPWGILGVHDTSPREFADQDVNFVQSVAALLAAAASRHENEAALRRQHERLSALSDIDSTVHGIAESVFALSTRSDIERLVCERLAASDSYELAWIGTVEEGLTVSAAAGVAGGPDGLPVDDGAGPAGVTGRADRTEDLQTVGDVREDAGNEWQAHAREHGYGAAAAVPVAAGEDRYGTLTVCADRTDAFGTEERDALCRLGSIVAYALTAVERDRELQRERNRLEFVNRLLRHNLLNGLNVVDARLELLDGRVDPGLSDHLDTAVDRTRGMIGFVETVREVTGVVGGAEPELEPVDLGAVLTERVARARRSYPDTDYRLDAAPDVDVVADDLLGEVLDNVLVNAAQHNPRPDATVRVDATVADETAVVEVADNGPGIPDDRKAALVDRATVEFDDPSSGFGLFLVAELLDVYGGDLAFADNDPTGTVVRLTLRRA